MNIVTGDGECAKSLLKAFRLEGKSVIGIEFSISKNSAAVVKIERFIETNEWDEMVTIFEKYNLVPVVSVEGVKP